MQNQQTTSHSKELPESIANWMEVQNSDIHKDQPLERGDLPSASKIESYSQCRGKYLMEKEFPAKRGETNADASRGTKLHAILGGASGPEYALNDDEYDTLVACRRMAHDIYSEWTQDIEDTSEILTIREKRLWLRNDAGEKIFSGQNDLAYLNLKNNTALIIDYKTGRSDNIESSRNEQLRSLAVLAFLNYLTSEISVAIVQPLATSKYEICKYENDDLFKSRIYLELLLKEINDPASKSNRTPGDCCKYCSAKLYCPQAMSFMNDLKIPWTNDLTTAQLSELLDRCIVVENIIKHIRKLGKDTINQGTGIENWYMKDGAIQRKIPNSKDAWIALRPSMTPDEFISCCTVKIGEIDDVIKEKTGLTGDELKSKVSELLGSAMLEERNESSLKRLK